MVSLAADEGLRATALVTAMDSPLGSTIGNALEIREAVDCLRGGGPEDVRAVTLELGAELLTMHGGETLDDGRARLRGILADGAAAERFARGVARQGGDARVVEDPDRLRAAPVQHLITADRTGCVARIDARALGVAAVELGAGRRSLGASVDHGALVRHATICARGITRRARSCRPREPSTGDRAMPPRRLWTRAGEQAEVVA